MRNTSRLNALFACVAVAALAGCGGGGSSSAPPPPPPPPPAVSGTISGVGCVIPVNQAACDAKVSWTTTNATTPRVTAKGATISTLPSGNNQTLSIGVGATALQVLDGTTTLASASVSGVCADGTAANGSGVCISTALHYEKTATTWDGGYPFATTKAGLIQATNLTSIPGSKPFINCAVPPEGVTESDGSVQLKCTSSVGGNRLVIKWDLVANELHDFTGTPLADDQFTLVESNSVQPVAGTTCAHSTTEGGTFCANPSGRVELDFYPDVGAMVIVKQGTFLQNGTIGVIRTFRR